MNTIPNFDRVGWARLDYSPASLDAIIAEFGATGRLRIAELDVAHWRAAFLAYCAIPQYQGEYKVYGGQDHHCFLEKALEHFLSIVIGDPKPGQTVVDVGSCKSVVPDILRNIYGVRCYEQDLTYAAGIGGNKIGSSADNIPLPSGSVDLFTLHCTFEHFEGGADTGFVNECGRLLRAGGKAIILPLYLNAKHVNVTGEAEPAVLTGIGWDQGADHYCVIPEWQNRFGRHYSPSLFQRRILNAAFDLGLSATLYRVRSLSLLDPRLWLNWVLTLEKPAEV